MPDGTGHRGDTLVEVIFATAVLSFVLVGALTIMSRGVATAQAAVEVTFVRQAMDAQAELLRYTRDGAINQVSPALENLWQRTTNTSNTNPQATRFGECQPAAGSRSFFIDVGGSGLRRNNYDRKNLPSTFATAGSGLWVEAVKASTDNYIDFHIRACWDSPSGNVKQTLGTIVRLTDE